MTERVLNRKLQLAAAADGIKCELIGNRWWRRRNKEYDEPDGWMMKGENGDDDGAKVTSGMKYKMWVDPI